GFKWVCIASLIRCVALVGAALGWPPSLHLMRHPPSLTLRRASEWPAKALATAGKRAPTRGAPTERGLATRAHAGASKMRVMVNSRKTGCVLVAAAGPPEWLWAKATRSQDWPARWVPTAAQQIFRHASADFAASAWCCLARATIDPARFV